MKILCQRDGTKVTVNSKNVYGQGEAATLQGCH